MGLRSQVVSSKFKLPDVVIAMVMELFELIQRLGSRRETQSKGLMRSNLERKG